MPVRNVHVTEVDGVPAVWAHAPGPLCAGLMIRMGAADETLPTAGTAHLLEHLALFGVGRPGDHSNGSVDQTVTTFHVTGDTDTVTGFLDAVTRQLTDVPLHRLEAERGVIEAEQAGRRSTTAQSLHTWRYGARTYGLAGQYQYGVSRVAPEELLAWSRRFVTRGNAALWLSGPPPAGLRLNLPDGGFQAPPDPHESPLPALPAWYPGPRDGVALLSVLPRTPATSALRHVLRSRLVDELRTLRALAYSPGTDFSLLTGDTGRLLAFADLTPDRGADGVEAFLGVLEGLTRPTGSEGAVTPADLEEWRRGVRRELADPMVMLGVAVAGAWRVLFGGKPENLDDQLALQDQVTCEDVALMARTATSGALLAAPQDHPPRQGPWTAAPASTAPPLHGDAHTHLDPHNEDLRLVLAPGGLSLRFEDGQHITAMRHATAAVLRWPEGRRTLVAHDGAQIDVEPTLWRDGHRLTAAIDASWPEHLCLDMPQRPAGEIPRAPAGWRYRRVLRRLRRPFTRPR